MKNAHINWERVFSFSEKCIWLICIELSLLRREYFSSRNWKCSKLDVNLKNTYKNWEKVFCFPDKFFWIACIELSLLRRECLSSAINVLIKSLKAFYVTARDFFQLNYLHNDQQIWHSSYHWDWISVSARLPCWLGMGHLKRDFLDIYVTTFSGVRNFGNT